MVLHRAAGNTSAKFHCALSQLPSRYPLLGRPKGSRGRSKLDGKEGEIRMLLEKQVSKASIAKIMGVSSTNLRHFIRTRKLTPETSNGGSKSRVRERRP